MFLKPYTENIIPVQLNGIYQGYAHYGAGNGIYIQRVNSAWDGRYKNVPQPRVPYVYWILAKTLCGDVTRKVRWCSSVKERVNAESAAPKNNRAHQQKTEFVLYLPLSTGKRRSHSIL
ncbi:hypothetical protein DXN05_19930 [Deminuibacter soli]|uniref:Uncharacterized protein n=1 Tax=Deminuibacter soli TaxID=2291815 RepID=A0A3E1NET2_9BACT|nr:hypothetical protein DXN05_19930 [Deminuibacter soli]